MSEVVMSFGTYFSEWKLYTFPEVIFFQEGPGLRSWQWTDDGMKVINVTNILQDGSINIDKTDRHISIEEFEERYTHFAIEPNDIVIASSGNTYGKIGRIRTEHLPLMMNTSVIRFYSLDQEVLDDEYLFSFLRSHLFMNQVEMFVVGSAQPNFGPTHLKEMKIPLPDIYTQRKIAGVLSAYDDAIENNTRRIKALEEAAQTLYREWFVEFRYPGHEAVPLVESELGMIPQGWEVGAFSQYVEINPRIFVDKDYEMPYIPMANISETSMIIETKNIEYRTKGSGTKFQNYDTLFARITPSLENGKTGFVQFLPSDSSVAIGSTEFYVFRSGSLPPEYIYLFSRIDDFRKSAAKSMVGASGRQRVQKSFFDEYKIFRPNVDILNKFVNIGSPIFQQIHLLAQENSIFREARDGLLPRLVSGEVDVSELDVR